MAKGIVWVGTPFILNFENPMEFFQPLVDEGLEVRLDECRGQMPEEDVIKCLPDVTAVIAGAEPYTARVIENAPPMFRSSPAPGWAITTSRFPPRQREASW